MHPFVAKLHARRHQLLLMAPFLALYYLQLAHHTVWRDEINAWAIAFVSHSLPELLHRVHYEAHPALWYLLLYPFTKITHAVWMLKAVQGMIGTGIFLLLALTTPFSLLELAMIFAGYYISFQYTVMCRMYGLEVLFALIYVYRRMHRPDRMACNVFWLGLIANVDSTGGILSAGLLLEYLWSQYDHRRLTGRPRPRVFVGALAVYVLCVAVSVASLWPAKDIGWTATGRVFSQFDSAEHLGSAFAKWSGLAFFPQTLDWRDLWFDPQLWPHGVIVPFVLLLFYVVFRKHKRLGWMLISIALMGTLFSHATGVSGLRHIGSGYIAFLIALWMLRYERAEVSKLSYVLLGLTVIGTVYNIKDQWGRPFVDADDAAHWITANQLQDIPLMGTPEANIIGVPERLGRPVYQLQCDCFDEVMTFSNQRTDLNVLPDIPGHVVKAMHTLRAPKTLLLENTPLSPDEMRAISERGIGITLLAAFTRGYTVDEHFYVYSLTASP